MATDDHADFDIASLFQAPATAMAGFLGLADGARKAVTGILDTIASLQRAAAALEKLTQRMTALLDDVEAPVRALTPEFERAMAQVQRVADAFEGPVDRLLPRLENAVKTFDRVALSQLPENLDQLRDQVVAIVEVFGELPRRLAGFAQFVPGLERLAGFRPVTPTSVAKTAEVPSASLKVAVKKVAAKKVAVKKVAAKERAVKKVAARKPSASRAGR